MCRHAPPSARSRTATIMRAAEASAAAVLAVTSIVLFAVYLADEIAPHPGNVMLTLAGVSIVIAVVLVIHCHLWRIADRAIGEISVMRVYTMTEYAEGLESHTDPYDDTVRPIHGQ